LFEFEEGVVGGGAVFVVFAVTDDCCVALFNEVVCNVFSVQCDCGCITGTESFARRLGIVNLDVDLSVRILIEGGYYSLPNDSLSKVFSDLGLPGCLFGVVGPEISFIV
jgi:hypothetical protein